MAVGALTVWRQSDMQADRAAWNALAAMQGADRPAFSATMLSDLPEPAERFFRFVIAEGTPLTAVSEITMSGKIGLGGKEDPRYQPMHAQQVLAPPHGFVWRLDTQSISGSDGLSGDYSWTRFWLFGLVPVVRVSGDGDHRRSAFGRLVAEAAFWAPASLLPGPHVRWEPLGTDSARAIVRFGGLEQNVDLFVDAEGRPLQVTIKRWSNENPDREFRLQPFGGFLSEFADFGGYRLPTRVEGGNLIGTDDYFPFFKAEVTDIVMTAP